MKLVFGRFVVDWPMLNHNSCDRAEESDGAHICPMLLGSGEQENGRAVRDLATSAGPGVPLGINPNYDT
ncbi:hypothetical protein [Bradyrhizobium tunisiense]|uniref:hypothetical protein n=1 Tax=Bradyrhizobium tunisiense TaxID=3278709 RepID=UPI0035E08D2A